ncbi:MAG: 50S ribosomal protein L24 [Candidatus Aenigmarchaeota archaeon]|nr:50S ribosomal protein L24 [Candidatus Aenigmarchaeota archaeon]
MKEWSRHWISSKQRRKQRKYRENAPGHVRQKMISVNLDKPLRKDYKKRSLPVRKGDEVLVMRGSHRGKSGKITKVNLKTLVVYIDNVKIKKVSGQEVTDPIDPSNVKIIKLNLDDKNRMKFIKRKSPETSVPKQVKK